MDNWVGDGVVVGVDVGNAVTVTGGAVTVTGGAVTVTGGAVTVTGVIQLTKSIAAIITDMSKICFMITLPFHKL
jgi:hypothetical protein